MSLPLTHVTTWEKFTSIITDGYLKPKKCKFFKEELVYFNYGRLAHKPSDKEENWFLNSPIVMYFHPNTLSSCFRFFPFDTGAIIGGRFKNTELNNSKLKSEYSFGISDKSHPINWINYIYKTETDYMCLNNPILTNIKGEMKYLLLDMYNQVLKNEKDLDYRLTSIECQSNKKIKIENVIAIAAPIEVKKEIENYFKDKKFRIYYYSDKSVKGYLPQDLVDISSNLFKLYMS